jgi:F-type H+-transporting ATPase subunit delta
MIPGVIAKRYATALLELGNETGQLDQLVTEVQSLADAYTGSSELRAAFADPLVSPAVKKAILGDIAERVRAGATAKNVGGLLLDRRRIAALPAIAVKLREMADQKRGILRAEVLTAMPLPEEYFGKLQRELERITGRRIALDRKLDPSLICGVVVHVGDTVFDGSLVSRLRQLNDWMLPAN